VTVAPGSGHGLRLLRSHAGGAGEQVSAGIARGALAIRLNQLAARAGRAGRQRAVTPSGDRLRAVYDRCLQRLPADDDDHPLDVDVDAAEQVIADLAQERAG
jgi:histidine ammonia-lyase